MSHPKMTMSHRRKLIAIGDFLATLVSQSDKPHGETDYAETEFVTKELFDLPSEIMSGWTYPSYVSKQSSGVNFAFRPEQVNESLTLDTVILLELKESDDIGANVFISRKLIPTDSGMLIPDPNFN
ncbi:hypothetical protein ACR9WD_01350 [Glutamicibacter sp. PAEs-4]|uniref:hypothetical protein n=1 Tax=Glutamicibacter sp. PAEs-4 TaxID=3444114 RepID=UPI003EBF0351